MQSRQKQNNYEDTKARRKAITQNLNVNYPDSLTSFPSSSRLRAFVVILFFLFCFSSRLCAFAVQTPVSESVVTRKQLMAVVKSNNPEKVRSLLRAGVDVNSSIGHATTLLNYAAGCGNIHSITVLIESGANVNTRDWLGMTPLMRAAAQGSEPVVKLLLANGAAINARDAFGQTALWFSITSGRMRVSQMLLSAGAVVNTQGFRGDTPLLAATSRGRVQQVQLLLNHGADPGVANETGQNAIQLAAESKDTRIRKLFSKYRGTAMDPPASHETPRRRGESEFVFEHGIYD